MPLQNSPELLKVFSTVFFDSEMESDTQRAAEYAKSVPSATLSKISSQIQSLLERSSLAVEAFGNEANRWFGSEEEARAWLETLLPVFKSAADEDSGAGHAPKDSNGAVLAEGDSVTVIKDLKVKGGSSDLKRGTLIKKIHLIGDPGLIECRVDGSTLVLKTEFLRKA